MPLTTLPDPEQDIRMAYLKLIDEIDQEVSQLTGGRLAGRITCRPGCSTCCRAFSVLPLEAALLQRVMPAADGPRQEGDCLFLGGGLCSVYSCRPVICRTQGLPLAYVDEILERIEVSACPLNFPEDADLDRDDLLFMDAFNERLAALNLLYCQRHGLDPAVRVALADLVS
jgi:Fe-S-cluster containining protein